MDSAEHPLSALRNRLNLRGIGVVQINTWSYLRGMNFLINLYFEESMWQKESKNNSTKLPPRNELLLRWMNLCSDEWTPKCLLPHRFLGVAPHNYSSYFLCVTSISQKLSRFHRAHKGCSTTSMSIYGNTIFLSIFCKAPPKNDYYGPFP